MKYLVKIYTLIFITIFASLVYLFISIGDTEKQLNNNLESLFLAQAESFSNNLDKEIKHHIRGNIYDVLSSDAKLRDSLEHVMSVMISSSYKYIYVLYRDNKGNYRYLLDGSKIDKGEFNQKLNVNKKNWDKVYKRKSDIVLQQSDFENLWITYLKPMIFKNDVEAVIAIDFSMKLPKNISDATKPLHQIFFYIFFTIAIMLLILLYQTILNLRTKRDSITDPLTLAYNRNYLRDFLTRIDVQRYQIMMLDIDYFKKVNDNYGHKAGDYILSKTASIIKEEIRDDDILIRFGGEEFLIFIHRENQNSFLAKDIAERLRLRISKETFIYENISIYVTVSIGINCSPEHFKSISMAIRYSDEMLYIAKNEGRNKIVAVANNNLKKVRQTKSIHEFKEALEDNRVTCFFQAIYSLKENKIIKYEALVRMIEKNGDVVAPITFLDSIMYTNVYRDMTKRVLDVVFKNINDKNITISINLNFSDILDNDIYSLIISQIRANKALASWLVIELLEYELIDKIDIIKKRLLEIKSFGVKIAVDDFGSGYSNYTIFQTLPIDILKIDGSLIKDIDHSQIAYKITKSIVLLTQELNIDTVAEYVHSKEVLEVVKSLNITEAQGFYLAKPEATISST
jgi:diguanylate cyclase (GGDEF)-like protein